MPPARSEADTVVLYVFGGKDPYYQGNLLYFLLHGVLPDVDYVIVLQDGWAQLSETVTSELRKVPRNVKIVTHPNRCFDWGTYGWYLQRYLNYMRNNYKYVIFMNSSIRGPFYTAYEEQNWVTTLKQQLNAQKDVQIFGASINCELYPWKKIKKEQQRYNPHVQSYLLIMDFQTVDLLLRDPFIFQCHKTLSSAIHYAELGSSLAVLQAGYNIGSLQLRYQGVDWRKKENQRCNGNRNPTMANFYDSIIMPPLETLFIKVKQTYPSTRSTPISLGLWQESIRQDLLDPNENVGIKQQSRSLGLKEREFLQNQHCWDAIYYQLQNQDLYENGIFRPQQLWDHFLNQGYQQGRDYRFVC